MGLGAVAGTSLWIAPIQATPSPDDYVAIGNVFSFGDIGIMFNEIATSSVGDGYDRMLKGTRKVTPFPLILNYDITDTGQAALKAAGEDSTQGLYNFKMTFNDAITTPTTFTFKGKVTGFVIKGGGANDVRKADSAISIETDTIVQVLAA